MTYSENSLGYHIIGIAGQSNAHGTSVGLDSALDYTDPRILQLANSGAHNDKVVLASDPLFHRGGQINNNIGFAMSFARLYVQTLPPTKKVLLLPCAWGGTGFSDNRWNPPNDLAQNYKTQIMKALALPGNHRFIGTLWHQGETDTDNLQNATIYPEKLRALIEFIRLIPGAEKSFFVVGEMAPTWVADTDNRKKVQAALNNIPSVLPLTAVVSSQGLLTHDGIHFEASSERKLGERYFVALTNAATNNPAPPEFRRPPKFSSLRKQEPIISSPVPAPVNNLPAALFRFNFTSGAAVDISGNNRTLSIIAPASITDVPIRGKALRALETGDANVEVAPPSSYSKAVWLYTTSTGVNGNLMSSDISPAHVFWSPGSGGIMSAGHDSNLTVVSDPSVFPLGSWVHYACTYDRPSNTMKLFRNGLKVSENNSAAVFGGGNPPTRIGYYTSGFNTLQGFLDKPGLWGLALTEEQVLTLYTSEFM